MAAVAYNLKKLLKYNSNKAGANIKEMEIKAEKCLLKLISALQAITQYYKIDKLVFQLKYY